MSKFNNSKSQAAALKYTGKDYAPVIVASGHGEVADNIIDIAEQNGVPIYRDDSAAAILTMLNVGEEIPPSLYEIISGIYTEILKTAENIEKE